MIPILQGKSGDPRLYVCQAPGALMCVSPFGVHLGSIWGPFRVHLGSILFVV